MDANARHSMLVGRLHLLVCASACDATMCLDSHVVPSSTERGC